MLFRYKWLHILHNNHRSTNPPSVAGDVDRVVMMVYVDAHKLAERTCSSQLSEVGDKAIRCSREAYDRAIDVDNECARAVDFNATR
jgi:hypothetical protein